MKILLTTITLAAAGAVIASQAGNLKALIEQSRKAATGYTDTPQLPNSQWKVHDDARPRPDVVTPGADSAAPPSDAVVIFDGKDLSKFVGKDGQPADWKVQDGYFEVTAEKGDLWTKDTFGDCQVHIEWQAPNPPNGDSQGRGNSGVFLMDRYEFQVLDCYENKTYADGQAGGIYGQYPPLVNPCRKPGEWQTYDIIFTAPRFKDGKLVSPAYATVLLNGVVTQNHTPLMGGTTHKAIAEYHPHPDKLPIRLQDHGDPVRFRNFWVRPLAERKD